MYDSIDVYIRYFDTIYIKPEIYNSIIQYSSLRARCSMRKEHWVHMSCYLPKYQEVSNFLTLCGRKKRNFFWANTMNNNLCKHFWVCSVLDLNICLVLPNTGTIRIVKRLMCKICSHFNMGQYITKDCIRLALCTGSLSVGVTKVFSLWFLHSTPSLVICHQHTMGRIMQKLQYKIVYEWNVQKDEHTWW